MKKLFTHIIIILIILFFGFDISAQDPHFSQFYTSPLYLNPALTGMKNGDIRITTNYRRQWASISEPYQTMSIAADYNILRGSIGDNLMGVGLIIFNDKAGSAGLRRTKIGLSTAYSQNLMEGNYISIGIEAAAFQQSINFEQLLFESQYDGESLNNQIGAGENFANNTVWNYDLAAGVAWNYSPDKYTNFYLGGSMAHLNRPNLSFFTDYEDPLHIKYTIYGGAEFRLSGYISALPRIIILQQGPHSEINFGLYTKMHLGDPSNRSIISIGMMYRLKDAIIPMIRFDHDVFAFGFSYDINISSLSPASNAQGGIEFSFIYKGKNGKKDISPIPCPTF